MIQSRTELDPMEKASYCFTVDEAELYRIKGSVYSSDVFNNSFYVQVDGNPEDGYLWHTQVNADYAPEYVTQGNGVDVVEVELAAGVHTIDIFLREDGTRLDKLMLEPATEVQSASVLTPPELAVRAEGSQWLHGSLVLADTNMSWRDLDTAALAETQVTLANLQNEGFDLQRTTGIDLDGEYYFDNIPTGQYALQVTVTNGYRITNVNPAMIEVKEDDIVDLSHIVAKSVTVQNRVKIFLPLLNQDE